MHIVTLEDATYILQKDRIDELSFLDDIFSNARKGDIHIVSVTHCPSKLSPGIISAAANKIVCQLNSGEDRAAVQRHMGISDEKEKDYFCRLDYEEHEVIIEFTKRARPFIGNILHVEILPPMSKKELYENSERIMAGFSRPVERSLSGEGSNGEGAIGEETLIKESTVGYDGKKFLSSVFANLYKKTLTEIYSEVGFSACKGTRVSKKLEKDLLIKIINISKGKGVSKFPVLLEDGYNALNVEERKFEGKGCGYEHLIWQHILAGHFKEYKAVIELNRGDKCIDVGFEYEGKLIAVEVAMTSAHEKVNIEKDIGMAKAELVIIGCKDEKVLDEVKEIVEGLGEELRNKSKAMMLSKILGINIEEVCKEKT